MRTGGRTLILGVDELAVDTLSRGSVSGITGGWKDMEDALEAVRGLLYMGPNGLEVINLADWAPYATNNQDQSIFESGVKDNTLTSEG